MGELNLISLGLYDEKDISVKALEKAKTCDVLYLENYTHLINTTNEELSKFIGKRIMNLSRNDLENNSKKIIEEAKTKKIGILSGGDCLTATTHQSLLLEAKKANVKTNIIHGSSVFVAIAETGLSLYNFGKVTSIPFKNENVKSSVDVLKNNQKLGLHTLFILDLDPESNKYLSINKATEYLIKNRINENTKAVACIALGSDKQEIFYSKLKDLKNKKINRFPQCLIIPGKLHFIEEEMLNTYKA